MQIVHPQSNIGDRNCVFCLGSLEIGESVICCPKCNEIHHTACWEENDNVCASSYGCNGTGEIDWVNPLEVQKTGNVKVVENEGLTKRMASLLGVQAQQIQGVPALSAIFSEISPIYILAIHQIILVSILTTTSKGEAMNSIFLKWQYWLTSNFWLWVIGWLLILALFVFIDILRGNPTKQRTALLLTILSGLGLWGVLLPLIVELYFLPHYLWPDSIIGSFFQYISWGRPWLAIVLTIPMIIVIIAVTIQLKSIPSAIVGLLRNMVIMYLKVMASLVGLGTIAWIGISIGSQLIASISGQNWILAPLMQNGLRVTMNTSFISLLLIILFTEIRAVFDQSQAANRQQKELANA